jgi:hypothetical protein
LWIDGRISVTPEINPRRALFVLGKIDEVRAKQYWKLQKLNSFDSFLEKRFRRRGAKPIT